VVAYASDESGKNEVYVSPFRGSGGKQLVQLPEGQRQYGVRRQGISILGADGELMAARVNQNGSAPGIDVVSLCS